MLLNLDGELAMKHPRLLSFTTQLKAGRVSSVLEGTYLSKGAEAKQAEQVSEAWRYAVSLIIAVLKLFQPPITKEL